MFQQNRITNGKVEYLLQWKGNNNKTITWEEETNMSPALIKRVKFGETKVKAASVPCEERHRGKKSDRPSKSKV